MRAYMWSLYIHVLHLSMFIAPGCSLMICIKQGYTHGTIFITLAATSLTSWEITSKHWRNMAWVGIPKEHDGRCSLPYMLGSYSKMGRCVYLLQIIYILLSETCRDSDVYRIISAIIFVDVVVLLNSVKGLWVKLLSILFSVWHWWGRNEEKGALEEYPAHYGIVCSKTWLRFCFVFFFSPFLKGKIHELIIW